MAPASNGPAGRSRTASQQRKPSRFIYRLTATVGIIAVALPLIAAWFVSGVRTLWLSIPSFPLQKTLKNVDYYPISTVRAANLRRLER